VQAARDFGLLYREEIETCIAAVRPRIGENGVDKELQAIEQTVAVLETEARKNRSAARKQELLLLVSSLRREVMLLVEENNHRMLLKIAKRSAAVEDDDEKHELLTNFKDQQDALQRSADNLERNKHTLVRR